MIKIIDTTVTNDELKKNASKLFGNLVKAVVDVEQKIMAVYGELHSDEEAILLDAGSKQTNLWGINIYPEMEDDQRIEFDSMINLRPSQNNMSRGVDNIELQNKIKEIVNKLISQ